MSTLTYESELRQTEHLTEAGDWGAGKRIVHTGDGFDFHQLESKMERLACSAGLDLDELSVSAGRHFLSSKVVQQTAKCSPEQIDELVNDELRAFEN